MYVGILTFDASAVDPSSVTAYTLNMNYRGAGKFFLNPFLLFRYFVLFFCSFLYYSSSIIINILLCSIQVSNLEF